jgi:hypothetical protein
MANRKRSNGGSARTPRSARAWGGITVKGDVCRWALPLRASALEIIGDEERVVPVVILRDTTPTRG